MSLFDELKRRNYDDEPVEAIEFNYSLPPGVALD